MEPLELLDHLDELGITITTSVDNQVTRLVVDAPRDAITPELADDIRHHRDLIVATVIGRRTGYALAPCTSCGGLSMVQVARNKRPKTKSSPWPTCRTTPRCGGHHVPRYADTARVADRPNIAEASPPPRAGKARLLGPVMQW